MISSPSSSQEESRRQQVIWDMAGVPTRHYRLLQHLHHIFVEASPICQNLEADESAYSFLGICVRCGRCRRIFLSSTTLSRVELGGLTWIQVSSLIRDTGQPRVRSKTRFKPLSTNSNITIAIFIVKIGYKYYHFAGFYFPDRLQRTYLYVQFRFQF